MSDSCNHSEYCEIPSFQIPYDIIALAFSKERKLNRVLLRMDFMEINSRVKRGGLLERIDRQNSRFRTAKTVIIKFGLHASFVELESAKNVVNESSGELRQNATLELNNNLKEAFQKCFRQTKECWAKGVKVQGAYFEFDCDRNPSE
ncbi:hypothetical protein TNCV_2630911 [Trichonephila clavipes]|nr:hypothetical protein TNCV_2630911 [Trichonephila clavipes]